MTKNPFKFLDSYTLADKEIFFGRENEIEEVYSRLFHSKLLLVYGPSGSGKTSLLQCGVANRLGEQNWKPIFIRRRQNILQSVHAELDKQAITPFKKEKTVTEKLYSLYLDFLTPVYLVFDQFEELFIFGDAEEKKEFVTILKDILSRGDINTQVVLSIREEYLASLSEFEDELPQLFENRIRVEKMKKTQALSVITSPCEVCNVSLEKGLAETAVEKIINESATIELTWLQVLMDRLYKSALARKEEAVVIRLSDLEALGNIGDVLGNFLDEQLKQMTDGKNGEAVLKTLITSEGTKCQLNIDEIRETLLSNGHKLESERIRNIVQHFVTVRILSDKDENSRYELKHDSLAAKIYEWLTLSERELQEVKQFVENSYKSYLKTEHLLGKKELAYVSKYEDKLFLKEETAAYLSDSRQLLRNRVKIQQRVKLCSVLSFLILCFTLVYWGYKEIEESRMSKMALRSLLLQQEDPKSGLSLAIHSYQYYNSPLASKAMFESFYNLWNKDPIKDNQLPYKKVIEFKPCKAEILFAKYSRNGEFIYGYLADTSIMIWSQFGKELFHFRITDKPVLQLKMSPDNKILSCFQSDSTAFLFTISGKVLFQTRICYDLINPSRFMAFSPDNTSVAFCAPENKVNVYRTDGHLIQVLDHHFKAVTAVDFSKNGQFLATSSKDHTIVLYYYNHKKTLFDLYNVIKGHRDIVWSVEFADNNKYILSASEDRTLGIWDFKGNKVKNFSDNKNDISDPMHMIEFVYGKSKLTDAYFSPNEDYIVFRHFASSGSNPGKYLCLSWNLLYTGKLIPISTQIEVMPSGVIYKTSAGSTRFISHGVKNYYIFKENFTMFSSNASFMFGIDRNILKFYPINEKDIVDLAMVKKIFGVIYNDLFKVGNTEYDF